MLIQLLAVPQVPRVILGRLPHLPVEAFHLSSQMILFPFYCHCLACPWNCLGGIHRILEFVQRNPS